MYSDFFRINMPYGIICNDKNEWAAFNREYQPLGEIRIGYVPDDVYKNQFVYVKYAGLTDEAISKISIDGKIQGDKIFLYNDSINPMSQRTDDPEMWANYFKRLKILCQLKIANAR